MTHAVRFVAVVAVLIWGILAWFPLDQGPTPETDALRARAEAGDAEAQFSLGGMYEYGVGVPQDYVEAVRWHRLAADQGHAGGQSALAGMYSDGEGVSRDRVEAHMLLNLAAAQPRPERETYVRGRDRAADLMTADQLAEAQRRARESTPTPEP